ncbi:MAG: Smr/MutS family protein, partial [Negativicutes bacterium]|nr:Smr/MutS family protein [Negativicutes bacterium]
ELKCLQLAEQQECERILAGLAAEVGRYREGLTENVRLLAELDFIFAKARLAVQQRATRPLLGKGEELCLRNARHPLLPDRTVVPITVTMEGRKQLLITGPNTGGKTVAMKTIGLLSLMAQAGLFVPAAEGSRLPLFGGYYADIGDGQSIERNLSTFSGHLLNVIRILEQSHGEDLVLLDEIGTGTDPEEGAGLAVAVLEEMLSRPATVVATSHYPQLKLYAHNNRLVECAAVEFDEQDLTPTFRLLIGHSGGSNALATARRLGLPPSIIAAARQKLSDNYRQFDDALAELRQRCRQLAEQQAETERLNRQLAGELASWREGEQARLHRAEKLLVEARERAGRLVADARLQAGQLLDRLRELDRQLRERAAAVPALDRTAAEVSGRLEELSKQFQPGEEEGNERPAGRPAVPGRLAAGDRVYVHSLRRVATVKAVGEKEIVVQHQAFQARVGWEDCQLAEDGEEPERPGLPAAHRHLTGHRREFQSLVDLRGMTVEEAIIAADRHIDNALFCGAREVMLLHGKGTGALRAGLRRHFLRDARVEQITLAELSQGGTGVSVVRLK